MAAITQLIGSGLPGRRYGSFAGKGNVIDGPYVVPTAQPFNAGLLRGANWQAGATAAQGRAAGNVQGQENSQ